MKPNSFLLWLLAGWLAASAVSCAASRSNARTAHRAVSQRSEELRSSAASSYRAGEEALREEIIVDSEPVPAREVAAAVPLAALQELPEGARFVARQGSLAVAAQRRGDTLVVTARSDSLPRKAVRTVRTEIRRQRDSSATRCSEYRAQTADSIRQESRTETVAAPARSCGRWWFVVGAVCCAAVFAGIRRWL